MDWVLSQTGGGLFLGDFDHFTALVVAAFRTGAMGDLGLVAVRTFSDAWHFEVIVRAAGGCAPLRVSSFGIRHLLFLY
jgi:hypothetical protein